MTNTRVDMPIHCPHHTVRAWTIDAKCSWCEIAVLRSNLTLAEEGLANYALEMERLNKLYQQAEDKYQALMNRRVADEPLHVGTSVTYAPRYPSQLPRDGWTIDRLPPEPTYIIRHAEGSAIAVSAHEIQPALRTGDSP